MKLLLCILCAVILGSCSVVPAMLLRASETAKATGKLANSTVKATNLTSAPKSALSTRREASRRSVTQNEMHAPTYSLKLENYIGVQYYAPFDIGGQVVPAIYDTGSFEVIVLSDLCASCDVSVAVYDSDKSTSWSAGERTVDTHHFGSGPVLSKKALEAVRIGDASSPLVVANMPFWQVVDHQIDVWNKQAKFSAIIGLGHSDRVPELETDNGNHRMNMDSGDLTLLKRAGVNEFSICLERGPDQPPGWLRTGPAIASMKSQPNFKPVRVHGQLHWGTKMSQVAPDQVAWNPCDPTCGAIIDSGTSLIATSADVLASLSGLLGSIKDDCSNLNELPDLTFNLDGQTFYLPPAGYVLKLKQPVAQNSTYWDMLWGPPKVRLANTCMPAFIHMDQQTQFGPMWILGMPFLRFYYTIFDRTDKMMYMSRSTPFGSPATGPGFAAFHAGQHSRTVDMVTPTEVDLGAVRMPRHLGSSIEI